jgi:hypothetical protein
LSTSGIGVPLSEVAAGSVAGGAALLAAVATVCGEEASVLHPPRAKPQAHRKQTKRSVRRVMMGKILT